MKRNTGMVMMKEITVFTIEYTQTTGLRALRYQGICLIRPRSFQACERGGDEDENDGNMMVMAKEITVFIMENAQRDWPRGMVISKHWFNNNTKLLSL